jgi:hypothetical protein
MKNKKIEAGEVGFGEGLVISYHIPQKILGDVLTTLDILGLEKKQYEALKSKILKDFWSNLDGDSFLIDPKTHTSLRIEHKNQGNCSDPAIILRS